MKKIEVVSLDGGAKTGKSTIGRAIATSLSSSLLVKTADAGAFYRRATVAAFDKLGVDGSLHIADNDLDWALEQIVKAGTPFEDGYAWGDLERPTVHNWVSIVGRRPIVQNAMLHWYDITIQQAQQDGTDVLVINARNPRSHMAEWLQADGPLHMSVDLFIKCGAKVAAQRKLWAEGNTEPTARELNHEAMIILKRRRSDKTRPTDTFIEPSYTVPFRLGRDYGETVAQAWTAPPSEAPYPILFDTTHMPLYEMELAAQGLAQAALAFKQ